MQIVTIGGVTVGLCILGYFLTTWYPGRKPLQKDPVRHAAALAPFLFAWAYGCLTILGIGGLIGWIADTALWISSWLGDVALVWGVGTAAGQAAGGTVYLPLTQTGGAIVLILTAVMVAIVKKSTKHGAAIKLGAWCGICLGTSAGIAGFAAVPLAQAVNWLGQTVYGVL
ncbi:hypothetical protein GCM10010293_36760 [Streptomyces griseoflavus]|uniref:hypothetical protein n=1 Tax=Streptomyces griseoflavus TaxID=35619 RepID=UPI00167CB849|nr:hypothetical protein [Streptomyces griseoflavus]GGV34330.1 hypothetical protein GCM10010293_36760 [Streptomyces griseoflavus]